MLPKMAVQVKSSPYLSPFAIRWVLLAVLEPAILHWLITIKLITVYNLSFLLLLFFPCLLQENTVVSSRICCIHLPDILTPKIDTSKVTDLSGYP